MMAAAPADETSFTNVIASGGEWRTERVPESGW
jgi:hypothetical protein